MPTYTADELETAQLLIELKQRALDAPESGEVELSAEDFSKCLDAIPPPFRFCSTAHLERGIDNFRWPLFGPKTAVFLRAR